MALPSGDSMTDRKSTRLNSSHTVIYTLSLHDALPIYVRLLKLTFVGLQTWRSHVLDRNQLVNGFAQRGLNDRSEEHTSELQSHSDLHSFPTRRSSDLRTTAETYLCWPPNLEEPCS